VKAGILQSIWLWVAGCALTAHLCLKAVVKSLFSKLDRSWIIAQLQAWEKKLHSLIQLKIKVENPHQVNFEPGKPYILMPNHASLLDIPITFHAFPNTSIRMLAKKELSFIPLMGRAMKKAEFPFINRKNRTQAIKDLAYAKHLMEDGVVLWIAPEGTRSKTGELQAFKKGGFITAIQAGATIVPLAIVGADKILKKGQYRINLSQKVTVHVGRPIDASSYALENKDKLIETVRGEMSTLLQSNKT
jgi:1-acyl-sn-glycerol-3-phosphate acyltransferase